MDGQRPGTSASARADDASSCSRHTDNSLTGSQIDALIQKRSALRAQLMFVEQQLHDCPPSSAGGGGALSRGGSRATTAYAPIQTRTGPLRAQVTPVPPRQDAALHSTASNTKLAAAHAVHTTSRPPVHGFYETALPGAMQPGRYAFWPKRLPGAASHRSSMSRGGGHPPTSSAGVAATAAAGPVGGVHYPAGMMMRVPAVSGGRS